MARSMTSNVSNPFFHPSGFLHAPSYRWTRNKNLGCPPPSEAAPLVLSEDAGSGWTREPHADQGGVPLQFWG